MGRVDWSDSMKKLYRQRWRIWVIACLAHAMGIFHRVALAPMADRIMADFDVSATVFGSLGAGYFYVYASMQLPAGTLTDTLGPRKVITAGLLLSAAGSLIMSQAPSFAALYAGRLIVSFGVSVVWLNVLKLIMEWFRSRELATMTGLSSSLVNLGQVAAATPLALMIISVGWRMSLVTIAQVTFGLAAAGWFVLRDSPAQVGLPPLSQIKGRSVRQTIEARDAPRLSLRQRFKTVFGNKRLLPLFLVHFGIYGAYSTFFHNWAVVYLMQTYGLARDFAANFILIAAVGQISGAPLVGFLSDRIMHRRRLPAVIFSAIFLTAFLFLALWQGGHLPLEVLYPVCFMVGLGIGSVPLIFAAVRELADPSVRGTASGLINMGGFISVAIGQPLFGYLLDRGWRGDIVEGVRIYPQAAFQPGLLLCCGLAALGFIGALLIREARPKISWAAGGTE
jgi:sugar phosphate permease